MSEGTRIKAQMMQRLKHKSAERNARVELARQLKLQEAEDKQVPLASTSDQEVRLSLDLKRIA